MKVIRIKRVFLAVVVVFAMLFAVAFVMHLKSENDEISFKDRRAIKEYVLSKELTQIEFSGIDIEQDYVYTLNFDFAGNCDYNESLTEAVEFFDMFLKDVDAEDNLSILKNQPIVCEIQMKNDSGPEMITLSNFELDNVENNCSQIFYEKIMSVRISHNVSDISCLYKIKNDIEYLYLFDLCSDFIDFTELKNLKELHITCCRYSDNTNALTDDDVEKLEDYFIVKNRQ